MIGTLDPGDDPDAQLRGVFTGLPGTVAVVDVCLADPFAQRHLVDAEVLGDLSEGDARFTGARDTHDVVTELLRVGLGHGDHPSRPTRVGQPGSVSPIRTAVPPVTPGATHPRGLK